MSATMTRGICWALAALQVTPETEKTNRQVLGENDANNSVAFSLNSTNNHNKDANSGSHHHHHHHQKHQKHLPHTAPPATTSQSSITATTLLAGVVDAVLSLADVGNNISISSNKEEKEEDEENVQPKYSREDVADHCTDDSCWIIINNRVFDVTRFLRMHPGGEDIILEHGGHDATSAFIDKGHSVDAFDMLNEYCIGEVTKADWFPEKNHT